MKLTPSKKALLFQFLILVFLTIVLAGTVQGQGLPADPNPGTPSSVRYFYENQGQIIDQNDDDWPSIKYYTDRGMRRAYFADNKIHYVLHRYDETNNEDEYARFDMTFMCPDWETGCGTLSAHDQTDDFLNFFLSHCPSGITDVPGYKRVMYEDAFPNVNIHVTSDRTGLVTYFEMKPGAAPDGIVFRFDGQDSIAEFQGDLGVYVGQEAYLFPDGSVYEVDGGGNITLLNWTPSWVQLSSNTAGIVLNGSYDPAQTLVIKLCEPPSGIPTAATGVGWAAYHDGTAGSNHGKVMKADMSGDPVTIKAFSAQGQFPDNILFPAVGGNQQVGGGLSDLYIAGFNEQSERMWGTYYGAAGNENPLGMALDNFGSVYIVGTCGAGVPGGTLPLPTTGNPSGSHYQAEGQGFILRVSQTTGAPTWVTRIDGACPSCGANNNKKWPIRPTAVEVDASEGRVYVVGEIHDPNVAVSTTVQTDAFPLKAGPTGSNRYFQSSYTNYVGFIMEFATLNNSLNWSTLFNNNGTLHTVAKRNGGGVRTLYVGGSTRATANSGTYTSPSTTPPGNHAHSHLVNPGSGAYFQTANLTSNPSYEGLVAAFDDNYQLKWSTLFGGSGADVISSIDVNGSGDLCVVGSTATTSVPSSPSTSANNNGQFPIYTPGGSAFFQGTNAGGLSDDFVAKFNSNFNLTWCSYYGGQDSDEGVTVLADSRDEHPIVSIDRYNNVVMAGTTKKNTTANPNFNGIDHVDVPGMYFQPENASSSESLKGKDAYYAIFNSQNELKYAQHYGGNGVNPIAPSDANRMDEKIHDISTVNGRRIYSIMTSRSYTTPTFCPGPTAWCDSVYAGSGDAFVSWLPYDLISGATTVKEAKGGAGFSISAYPNPLDKQLAVFFISQKKQEVSVEIFDNTGRIVHSNKVAAVAGNNNFVIDTRTLSTGIYFLKINDQYSYEAIKLIKN